MADTKELRKFKKGIRLGALASPPNNAEKGAMYIDNSGKLFIHNGTDFEEVVDKTTAQTLENKSIDADNNTISNIEVDNLKSGVLDTDISTTSASDDTIPSAKAAKSYVDSSIVTERDTASTLSNKTFSDPITLDHETTPATPASGKVKVYAKNDNKLHILDSNGAESSIGSSSGGSLDTFHTEDFTTLQTSSINETSGKYSLDILNAGISKKTLKVTIDNSCTTGDKIVFPTINLNERQKGQTCSISFYYKTENEGGGTPYDEKIDVIVATDSGFTNTILVSNLKDSGSIKKFVDTFTIPSGTTNLYYGFKCNATLPNGVFYVDDVEMSQDPFVQSNLGSTNPHIITPAKSNLSDWTSYTPDTNGQSMASKECFWRRVGDSMEIRGKFKLTDAMPGSTVALFGLPDTVGNGSGGTTSNVYSVDFNKLTSAEHVLGYFYIVQDDQTAITEGDFPEVSGVLNNNARTAQIITAFSIYSGFLNFTDMSSSTSGTVLNNISYNDMGALGNKDTIIFQCSVPITGWGAQDSNFLAALPMTKYQKKSLGSNWGSSDGLTALDNALGFSNLTVGKIYKLTLQIQYDGSSDGEFSFTTVNGDASTTEADGNRIGIVGVNNIGSPYIIRQNASFIFKAINSAITYRTGDMDSGDILQAENIVLGLYGTSVILEELSMHEEVDIW